MDLPFGFFRDSRRVRDSRRDTMECRRLCVCIYDRHGHLLRLTRSQAYRPEGESRERFCATCYSVCVRCIGLDAFFPVLFEPCQNCWFRYVPFVAWGVRIGMSM